MRIRLGYVAIALNLDKVTSSSTLASYGAIGAGLPAKSIEQVITVCKAYSSAVGAGAFCQTVNGDIHQ